MFYFLLNSFILVYQTALERFKNAFERFLRRRAMFRDAASHSENTAGDISSLLVIPFQYQIIEKLLFCPKTNFLLPVRR